MIIVNAILYLSSAQYSILSFNQLFIIEILPYWFVAKNIGNYRKYDIFFNFRFTGNMIFPSIAENQGNMIFTLSVITKMLFFMQCRELHIMQLILNIEKPTTQTYFQKKFQNSAMEWKDMYILLRCVKINTNLCIFQYNYYIIFYILTKCFTNLKKRYLYFLFLLERTWMPNLSFPFLHRNKLSLDAATTFFPKYINSPSNYTTERHLWIYWS